MSEGPPYNDDRNKSNTDKLLRSKAEARVDHEEIKAYMIDQSEGNDPVPVDLPPASEQSNPRSLGAKKFKASTFGDMFGGLLQEVETVPVPSTPDSSDAVTDVEPDDVELAIKEEGKRLGWSTEQETAPTQGKKTKPKSLDGVVLTRRKGAGVFGGNTHPPAERQRIITPKGSARKRSKQEQVTINEFEKKLIVERDAFLEKQRSADMPFADRDLPEVATTNDTPPEVPTEEYLDIPEGGAQDPEIETPPAANTAETGSADPSQNNEAKPDPLAAMMDGKQYRHETNGAEEQVPDSPAERSVDPLAPMTTYTAESNAKPDPLEAMKSYMSDSAQTPKNEAPTDVNELTTESVESFVPLSDSEARQPEVQAITQKYAKEHPRTDEVVIDAAVAPDPSQNNEAKPDPLAAMMDGKQYRHETNGAEEQVPDSPAERSVDPLAPMTTYTAESNAKPDPLEAMKSYMSGSRDEEGSPSAGVKASSSPEHKTAQPPTQAAERARERGTLDGVAKRTEGERMQARLEQLPSELKDAARAYAQARYDAEQRIINANSFGSRIIRKMGMHAITEEELASDAAFKAAEEKLFAVREEIEQRLDETVAQRVAARKGELADDVALRERLARKKRQGKALRGSVDWKEGDRARPQTDETTYSPVVSDELTDSERAAVTDEDLAHYRQAYEETLDTKMERLKHALRYEYINVPLRELRHEIDRTKVQQELAGEKKVFDKALATAASWYQGSMLQKTVNWYRGDRSSIVAREKTIVRNAALSTALLAAIPLTTVGVGAAALYFGARLPTKVISALIGANAGIATSAVVGKGLEQRYTKQKGKLLDDARAQAKTGTEEGRKRSLREVFQAEEHYERGQKKKVVAQATTAGLVGIFAGVEANAHAEDIAEGVGKLQDNTAQVIHEVAGTLAEKNPLQKVPDIQDLYELYVRGGRGAQISLAEAAGINTEQIPQPITFKPDAVPSMLSGEAVSGSVPTEPTPTLMHLTGHYDAGQSVESVLAEKLQEAHANLDTAEAGAVAHRIVEDLKDSAEAAQGFGVDNNQWDAVDAGEVYDVDISNELINKHILAIEHPDVPEGVAGVGHAEQVVVSEPTPTASAVESIVTDARFRGNAFYTDEVASNITEAQRAVDWIGNNTRPALKDVFGSELLDRVWAKANQPLIESHWGVIEKVPVDKLFDRTPGVEYVVDGTTIRLLPETETYLRTFMNRLDTIKGTDRLFFTAQQEHWTVGQLVQAIAKEKLAQVTEAAVDTAEVVTAQPVVPQEQVVPETAQHSDPAAPSTSGGNHAYYGEKVPYPPNTWQVDPRYLYGGGHMVHPGYPVGWRGAPVASIHAGGQYEAGPVGVGGSAGIDLYSRWGARSYTMPPEPPPYVDRVLAGKYSFDVDEVRALLESHPHWQGKTFGELAANDPDFLRVWRNEVRDVQLDILRNNPYGPIPKRMIGIGEPPADTPAALALENIKKLESYHEHVGGRRYGMYAARYHIPVFQQGFRFGHKT